MFLLILACLFHLKAGAEVDGPFILPIGDRESLMGNSGVSVPGSAGNIFYNPAGLYQLTGRKFSASGSAYAYVKGRAETFGDTVEFDSLVSVPNMIAMTRRYRSWTYGFGIFSPIAFESSVDTRQTVSSIGLSVSLNSTFRTEEQYIGVASGKDIGNGWAFGLGIFVHRYLNKSVSSFFASPDPTAVYISKSERTELEVLGLLTIVGLQKDLTEKLRLGVRVAAPDLELMGRSIVHSEQLSESGGTVTEERVRREEGGNYRLPLDVTTGLSWTPNGKHFVSLDIGVQAPTSFDSTPGQTKGTVYDTKTTVRQNLGYEYHFNDDYSMVVGLIRSPSAVGDSRDKEGTPIKPNNFFGMSLGAYAREKIATSGFGVFYLNSSSEDVGIAAERDKRSGFQIYGLILTTSINY